MTVDELVLYELERWFRAKLRGETDLQNHETRLFSALAERQNARGGNTYLPKDSGPTWPLLHPPKELPTTKPPPPGGQQEWLRLSRGGQTSKSDDPER